MSRAAKLYQQQENRAIQILKQAHGGSKAAGACFSDLLRCSEGEAKLTSIDWEKHHVILAPKTSEAESCKDRAAQLCIDWLIWMREIGEPMIPLRLWLGEIGNPVLREQLGHFASLDFTDRTEEKEQRRKQKNRLRQQRRRLKLKGS